MKNFKKLLRIGFILVLTFPFLFIYLTFANSKGCDQLVIDTYEIHSNIDIPRVVPINCYYDEVTKVRISIYELDDNLIQISRFSLVNKLEALNSLHGKLLLSENELPSSEDLRIATGQKWGRTWTYLYEEETNRLWAELKY